jgi:transposase InsO family protein
MDLLEREGIRSVRCPVRAPNCNAYAERVIRSVKEECLDRMVLFGKDARRRALREFVTHYHRERNHQGAGNELVVPADKPDDGHGTVARRQRLGGLLSFYYRQVA